MVQRGLVVENTQWTNSLHHVARLTDARATFAIEHSMCMLLATLQRAFVNAIPSRAQRSVVALWVKRPFGGGAEIGSCDYCKPCNQLDRQSSCCDQHRSDVILIYTK